MAKSSRKTTQATGVKSIFIAYCQNFVDKRTVLYANGKLSQFANKLMAQCKQVLSSAEEQGKTAQDVVWTLLRMRDNIWGDLKTNDAGKVFITSPHAIFWTGKTGVPYLLRDIPRSAFPPVYMPGRRRIFCETYGVHNGVESDPQRDHARSSPATEIHSYSAEPSGWE